MRYAKVVLTIADWVDHHDKTITVNVMGDPWPLAHAIRAGNFDVAVVETELTETLVTTKVV